MPDYLSLNCPDCGVKLRIKAAHAHLPGRCPACGVRILALRPRPYRPAPVSSSNQPTDLRPVEDEWPEPARVLVEEGDKPNYEVASTASWIKPHVEPEPSEDIYGLAAGEPPLKPPSLQTTDETPADSVSGELSTSSTASADWAESPTAKETGLRFSRAQLEEMEPEQLPPPPRFPYSEGIYTFPLRPNCLRRWFTLALGFTIWVIITSQVIALGIEMAGGNRLVVLGFAFFSFGGLFLTVIVGVYAGVYFLDIVEETAAGNDQVKWSDEGWREAFWRGLYMFWMGGVTVGLPLGLLWAAGLPIYALLLAIPLFFPIGLLSSLAADSMWVPIYPKLLIRLVRKLHVAVIFYVSSLLPFAACLYMSYLTIIGQELLLSPLAGLVLSASVLIYGRQLGRAGWMLTYTKHKPV